MEKGVLVRHRLDGILKEVMDLPKWVHEGLVARMKIMAGMDIAEKRLPQDGRLRVKTEDGKDVDFRVSSLRTMHGEKIVMRVLDSRKGAPPLEELGFSAAAMEELRYFLQHQHGMILVVGPTGSGKSTTLSSAITSIKSGRTNIITIEDPIEYQIPGHQPDAGQREGQAHVRQRAARDPPPGPRRHPGRRDPRSRDREDRDAGRADRPPRPLDAAHRRCAVDGDAVDGHEPGALRHRVGADRRGRAAAGAPAVPGRAAASTRRKPTRCARST